MRCTADAAAVTGELDGRPDRVSAVSRSPRSRLAERSDPVEVGRPGRAATRSSRPAPTAARCRASRLDGSTRWRTCGAARDPGGMGRLASAVGLVARAWAPAGVVCSAKASARGSASGRRPARAHDRSRGHRRWPTVAAPRAWSGQDELGTLPPRQVESASTPPTSQVTVARPGRQSTRALALRHGRPCGAGPSSNASACGRFRAAVTSKRSRRRTPSTPRRRTRCASMISRSSPSDRHRGRRGPPRWCSPQTAGWLWSTRITPVGSRFSDGLSSWKDKDRQAGPACWTAAAAAPVAAGRCTEAPGATPRFSAAAITAVDLVEHGFGQCRGSSARKAPVSPAGGSRGGGARARGRG